METDIATYAMSYVLARVALVCAFAYVIVRAIVGRHEAAAVTSNSSGLSNRVCAVHEDRC